MKYQHTWLTAPDRHLLAEMVGLVALVSAHDPVLGLPARPTAAQTELLSTSIQEGLAAGRTHALVVQASDRVVGCVVIKQPATANQSHIGELTTGAVHPGYRGRKVVTGALAEVVRHCDQVGIELLRLDVREGIRAEGLWRVYGFQEYGRLADYGRVDGQSYAGIYLAQPVDRLKHVVIDQEAAHAQQG